LEGEGLGASHRRGHYLPFDLLWEADTYAYRLDRTAQVRSLAGTVVVAESSYTYYDANQGTRITREDEAYWSYGYDALGQVASGRV